MPGYVVLIGVFLAISVAMRMIVFRDVTRRGKVEKSKDLPR